MFHLYIGLCTFTPSFSWECYLILPLGDQHDQNFSRFLSMVHEEKTGIFLLQLHLISYSSLLEICSANFLALIFSFEKSGNPLIMHGNYPTFPESSGGLTCPLRRIIFPSYRFCDPESFPLRTLRENGLWWMSTPTQFLFV